MPSRSRCDLVRTIAFAGTVTVLVVCGCRHNPATVGSAMDPFYVQNHWIPLPLPDSRFAPGVIFSYDEQTGIRYVSSLKTCGVPEDVTAPVVGQSGQLKFNTASDYGAKAVLQVKGVSAGPEFSKVKKTTLELSRHGPSSIDLFKVQIWLTDPSHAASFPQACKEGLAQPNVFIVQEAYMVSKGKYTLYDELGASIGVKGLKLGVVQIDPNASAKATDDGSLEFDEPLYTAVRRVRRINGGFQSLGKSAETKDADAEILKSMQR